MSTMASRAKVLGHASHPMLITVPLGMFTGAAVFDALYALGGRNRKHADVAYYMIATGLVGGAVASVPGWIDWAAIPKGTRAKGVGLIHGVGNTVGVLGLYALSLVLRRENKGEPTGSALAAAYAGFAAGGVTAWLGGELYERLGVGVDPGAHLNAPNSLVQQPARVGAPDAATTPELASA